MWIFLLMNYMFRVAFECWGSYELTIAIKIIRIQSSKQYGYEVPTIKKICEDRYKTLANSTNITCMLTE